jgi:hypothetical protein
MQAMPTKELSQTPQMRWRRYRLFILFHEAFLLTE